MISVSNPLQKQVIDTYGEIYGKMARLTPEKCGRDALDEQKVHDQVDLLCRTFGISKGELKGKKILEIGSGFGVFLAVLRRDYGAETYGIEPAAQGFDSSFRLAHKIIAEYGLDPSILYNAKGEDLPFPGNNFDFVFSSTVLEHTEDPALVLQEAIRVLRTNGRMQFVYPNYGAFFEGHYALPWVPYLNHALGRIWVSLWGRDPAFIDTLQLTNFWKTRRWLKGRTDISIVSYGEEIFKQRMAGRSFKAWAGLGTIKRWLDICNRLHIVRPLTWIILKAKSFDPIILSLIKTEKREPLPPPDNREIYEVRWIDWTDMKRYGPTSRWLRSLIGDHLARIGAELFKTKILDFGCGEGTTTDFIAQLLPETAVSGIDRSAAGIQCATARYSQKNLHFSCIETTSCFPDSSFALVTCFEVLEHVEDWRAMTKELARLSSRYLLVSFPTGRMRRFERNVGHLRNFRKGQFERYAESLGYSPVAVFYAGFPFYSPIFREICNIANSGGNSLTRGRYTWWQKCTADLLFFLFRHFSMTKRGDQFCGLFERK